MPRVPVTIQAVVFDLDDTLYLERDYVRSGYRAAAEYLQHQRPARPGEPRDAAQTYEAWLWQRFLAGQSAGAFDAMNASFRLALTGPQILELVDVYRRHRPDVRPCDGIPEMLGRLHADFRLALLTDGYLPGQRLKLEALKIERFFDAVVFTEELGRSAWKPSPAGFEVIHRKLGVAQESLAYVADNPGKDFVAPNLLSWRTVQFLQPGQIHARRPAPPGGEPQIIVRSPGELRDALLGHERVHA